MIKILVVDDEPNIRKLIKMHLDDDGFETITASSAKEALSLFETHQFNLIITDIMMPQISGIELVRTLRDMGYDIPAVIVSAKGEIESKIEGFSVGVDDYMTKPIDFQELSLRINALLRRVKILKEKELILDNLTLKYNELSITDTLTNKKLVLPPKEFYLLYKLLSFPEKVFTKDELFDEFWGANTDSFDDTIKTHIYNIRSKIEMFDTIDIVTVRGVGYYGHCK